MLRLESDVHGTTVATNAVLEKRGARMGPLVSERLGWTFAYHLEAGERLVFRTAGAGGWGDPLGARPAPCCARCSTGLLFGHAAREDDGSCWTAAASTRRLRASAGRPRDQAGEPASRLNFDFGELPEGRIIG